MFKQCGGDYGRVSIYFDFAAPVTVGLNVFLTNSDEQNVAIDYTMDILPPPTPGGKYILQWEYSHPLLLEVNRLYNGYTPTPYSWR